MLTHNTLTNLVEFTFDNGQWLCIPLRHRNKQVIRVGACSSLYANVVTSVYKHGKYVQTKDVYKSTNILHTL